ncbi:gamma-aminobutyric acid type B receptor subunit 2-like [Gigantopelta aegis]|uniref:gamma-aminobutyric acid type B receptor subunit 2-like n=1 Tax=Gigantopelta aegis TaxID=1735272 RepID=UPI001B88CE17|nr:gamma-aminobutyric acid type B receptor subunit 2-like [Gigantopelta aegis]XP_041356526.1 gamma-aminobutyric acid type B receptor subunit 2-like [Gigantopelta aegis]
MKIGMFTSVNLFIMVVWSVIDPSRPKAILMHSRVNITVMNDSKPIALCIYIVILLSIVGLPVSLIQNDNNPNVSFSVISILIITGTTSTQCNIFFPKVDALLKFLRGEKTESKSSQQATSIPRVGTTMDSIHN